MKFSQALADNSPFAAREFIAGKDAVILARDILALDQDAFGTAFRKAPMKRAKLRGLQRSAAVVLGNAGRSDDIPLLNATQHYNDQLVAEHCEWARDALNQSTRVADGAE